MARRIESGLSKSLVDELVNSSNSQNVSIREATTILSSVSNRDYAASLRKLFDISHLRSLASQLARFLPGLNEQVFGVTDLGCLERMARNFGVMLRTNYVASSDGRRLRGYYLNDRTVLKTPLIWLNSANHPVGVAATFWHEMGHHLTHEIFGSRHSAAALPFATDYLEHLERPEEIAADLVMALGCYPREAAEAVFRQSTQRRAQWNFETSATRVRSYVKSVTGFDFSADDSARTNLYRLAGMIHVAKLRLALLREYSI